MKTGVTITMRLVLFLTLLVLAGGCGAGDWGTVSGRVTLDDQPLEKGDVTFNPVKGGAPGTGRVVNGAFTIQTGTKAGLAAGEYLVTVADQTIPKSGSKEAAKLLTPKKYADPKTSDLKATIQPGSNPVELKMVSTSK